jgi:uncharacterized OB-fold protein
VRGIVRAAAYLPRGTSDGCRVVARDEDEFTLAAAALERLAEHDEDDPMPVRLLLVGARSTDTEVNLARFWGAPLRIERFPGGFEGLRSALAATVDPVLGSDPVVVVGVDLPSRGTAGSSPPFSDAGVALEVGVDGAVDPKSIAASPTGAGLSTTAALFAHARAFVDAPRGTWVGDWGANPREGPTRVAEPPETESGTAAGPVSQGAYVPHARYLESLPSRWTFAADTCAGCGALTFPARGRCRQCDRRDGLRTVHLPRDGGEVVASTRIGPGGQPTEFDDQVAASGPYGVVLVDLAPGVRATLSVTDSPDGTIAIGSRVATALRRLYRMEGEWRYGRKAMPRSTA